VQADEILPKINAFKQHSVQAGTSLPRAWWHSWLW